MVLLGKTDTNKTKNKLNKGKILKISIALVCIILFIFFIAFYENDNNVRNFFDIFIFRKIVNEEKLPSVEIDTSKNINIYAYSKYFSQIFLMFNAKYFVEFYFIYE